MVLAHKSGGSSPSPRIMKKKKLKKQIKRQRLLLSALYQILGALNASTEVLDTVSNASYGLYNGDGKELLPYGTEDTSLTVHDSSHSH